MTTIRLEIGRCICLLFQYSALVIVKLICLWWALMQVHWCCLSFTFLNSCAQIFDWICCVVLYMWYYIMQRRTPVNDGPVKTTRYVCSDSEIISCFVTYPVDRQYGTVCHQPCMTTVCHSTLSSRNWRWHLFLQWQTLFGATVVFLSLWRCYSTDWFIY